MWSQKYGLPTLPMNVRDLGRSRRHMLTVGFTAPDPKPSPPYTLNDCCGYRLPTFADPVATAKLLLTYLVPYFVSTYGAVSYRLHAVRLAATAPEPAFSR